MDPVGTEDRADPAGRGGDRAGRGDRAAADREDPVGREDLVDPVDRAAGGLADPVGRDGSRVVPAGGGRAGPGGSRDGRMARTDGAGPVSPSSAAT